MALTEQQEEILTIFPIESLGRARQGYERLFDFVREAMDKYGICLRYIGANTQNGRTERAIEILDHREAKGLDTQLPFDEYLWDKIDLDSIANKNGVKIVELDDLPGICLEEYRHGGGYYSENYPLERLPVMFAVDEQKKKIIKK